VLMGAGPSASYPEALRAMGCGRAYHHTAPSNALSGLHIPRSSYSQRHTKKLFRSHAVSLQTHTIRHRAY
jgi:hypothetical protein